MPALANVMNLNISTNFDAISNMFWTLLCIISSSSMCVDIYSFIYTGMLAFRKQ